MSKIPSHGFRYHLNYLKIAVMSSSRSVTKDIFTTVVYKHLKSCRSKLIKLIFFICNI